MKKPGKIRRAVLWDMDGTILDSAGEHWTAWKEILEAEGRPVAYEEFRRSFGQRNDLILRGIFGPGLSDEEIDRIGSAKEARYRKLVRSRGVSFLPGVKLWLGRFRERGWLQAVASSAPRENIRTVLDGLCAAGFFAAVVSAEDVSRGKPDPQVFLRAAERLGVSPSDCLVIEDAPAGIEAARRAGMKSVGVLNSHSRLDADISLRSLRELDEENLELLLRSHAAGGPA